MAQPQQQQLRVTDFLPKPFTGEIIDYDICHAHFLSFFDYLVAHDLNDPQNAADLIRINTLFKPTLVGKARLWAEGKVFTTVNDLRDQFLQRFSPSHSNFGNVKHFHSLTHIPGDSAEQTLNKIKLAAQRIGYGNAQIRDKFLQVLPAHCQAAVIMSAPADADAQILAQRAQQFFDFSPNNVSETPTTASKQVSFQTDQVHLTQTTVPPHTYDHHGQVLSEITHQMAKIQEDVKSLKLDSVHYSAQQSQPQPTGGTEYRSVTPHPNSEHFSRQRTRRSDSRDRYSSRSNSRSRGSSHSPFRDYRDHSRHHSPRRNPRLICHFCNKPNHKWRQCYTYQDMLRKGMNPAYFPNRPASGPQFQYPPPGHLQGPALDQYQAQPYPFQPHQAQSQQYTKREQNQRPDFH
jgi:hypothetical protein